MNRGFVYTRWLLTMTFFSLLGLLAVGMMAVHSKRTLRTLAVDLNRKEAHLEELGRRQNILDADLASALNPEYLKELIAMSKLRLGPPREDRIIVVDSLKKREPEPRSPVFPNEQAGYHTRFELVNNEPGNRE